MASREHRTREHCRALRPDVGSLPGEDIDRATGAGVRRAPGPAAPARAPGPRPGRRHDRPHRDAAGRPAGRSAALRLAAGGPARAWTSAAVGTCWPPTSMRCCRWPDPGTTAGSRCSWPVRGPSRRRRAAARRPVLCATPARSRDLVESLAETVREHLDAVAASGAGARGWCCSSTSRRCRRSWPAGSAPRAASATCACPSPPTVEAALAAVIAAAGDVPVVVHCCAADAPLRLLARCRRGWRQRRLLTLGAGPRRDRRAGRGRRRALARRRARRSARGCRRRRGRSPTRYAGSGTSWASPPTCCPTRSRSLRPAVWPAPRRAGRTRRTALLRQAARALTEAPEGTSV